MTTAVGTTYALEVEDLELAYLVRGVPREVLRGITFHVRPGEAYGLVGESGCGKSTTAFAAVRYLPRNGPHHRRPHPRRRRRRHHGCRTRSCASSGPRRASMVYQDPGAALEPDAEDRSPGRRGVHRARARAPRGRGARAGVAASRPHRRSGSCHAAVPPSALRRDAATRRHRHGARVRPSTAGPRRADDRPRRHGRSRGARPRPRAPSGDRRRHPPDRSQPRRGAVDVRTRRRDVRRQDRRGGQRDRGVREASTSVHRRLAVVPAPKRGAQVRAGAVHHPGHAAPDRHTATDVRVRRPLRPRRRHVPHAGAAAGRRQRRPTIGRVTSVDATTSIASTRCHPHRPKTPPPRSADGSCSA